MARVSVRITANSVQKFMIGVNLHGQWDKYKKLEKVAGENNDGLTLSGEFSTKTTRPVFVAYNVTMCDMLGIPNPVCVAALESVFANGNWEPISRKHLDQ